MLIDHIERAEFNAEEMRRGTLVFAKHKTWKEGISGIVYRASAEQITVMYPNSLTNTQNHFFIPVSEVYKNEWEIRYSGDGLRTVQEYKEPRSIRGYATVSICRSIRNDHRREPCMLQCIRIKPVR